MGVGPYHLIDITTKTFKFCLKYGQNTPIFGTLIYKFQPVRVARPPIAIQWSYKLINSDLKCRFAGGVTGEAAVKRLERSESFRGMIEKFKIFHNEASIVDKDTS